MTSKSSISILKLKSVGMDFTQFGFYEVKRGIPAPYHIVRLLVAEATARDWCKTGRRVDVPEAIDAGIVQGEVRKEALVEACRSEAEDRSASARAARAAIESAFRGEVERFEAALFREKRAR